MTDGSESLFQRSLEAERALLSTSAIRALAEEQWNVPRPLLDWPLLVLFVIAYALFFVRPGASLTSSSYEKRWRGRPMEERQTMLDRLRRWLKS